MPPENILSRHFEKYLYAMQQKLTEYLTITISFLISQNPVKIGYLELYIYISLKIGYFGLGDNYDVTVTGLVLTLVCMERGDPYYYYGTK